MTNRYGGPTVRYVYCQHLVITKDGAINDHHRDASLSIDAYMLECTSVMKTGRRRTADGGRPRYKNTALSIARAIKTRKKTALDRGRTDALASAMILTLTYNLDLQSPASSRHDLFTCKSSRSAVSWFPKQSGNKRTGRWTVAIALPPSVMRSVIISD